MATPTVEGTAGLLQETTSVTAHPQPYPTGVTGGIQAGDILFVVFGIDEAAAGTTVTNWNGFTQLAWSDITTNVGAGGCAYKRAVGGETGTITFTTNLAERAVGRMYCIRGAHASSNPEIGTTATASSTNPNPPAVTASWGSDTNLFITYTVVDIVIPTVAPANYTNLETATATSAVSLATARRALTAASDDPGVFTMATDQWLANTVVFRPAAAGGAAQTITGAGNIASAEAFGTPTVAPQAVTVTPTGIASAQAVGTPTVVPGPVTVSPSGIASGEAFGTPVVGTPGPSQDVAPSGIASAEAFGVPTITTGAVTVSPTGIPSAEAFGVPTVGEQQPFAPRLPIQGVG